MHTNDVVVRSDGTPHEIADLRLGTLSSIIIKKRERLVVTGLLSHLNSRVMVGDATLADKHKPSVQPATEVPQPNPLCTM